MTANVVHAQPKPQELLGSADLEKIEAAAALGAGFKNARQSAFARTLTLPFPTGSHELWRYTKPDHFDFKKLLVQERVGFSLKPFEGSEKVSGLEIKTGSAAVEAAGADQPSV